MAILLDVHPSSQCKNSRVYEQNVKISMYNVILARNDSNLWNTCQKLEYIDGILNNSKFWVNTIKYWLFKLKSIQEKPYVKEKLLVWDIKVKILMLLVEIYREVEVWKKIV